MLDVWRNRAHVEVLLIKTVSLTYCVIYDNTNKFLFVIWESCLSLLCSFIFYTLNMILERILDFSVRIEYYTFQYLCGKYTHTSKTFLYRFAYCLKYVFFWFQLCSCTFLWLKMEYKNNTKTTYRINYQIAILKLKLKIGWKAMLEQMCEIVMFWCFNDIFIRLSLLMPLFNHKFHFICLSTITSLLLTLLEPKVISLCHQYRARQACTPNFKSLILIMDSSKRVMFKSLFKIFRSLMANCTYNLYSHNAFLKNLYKQVSLRAIVMSQKYS